MFPIDQATLDYDRARLADFAALTAADRRGGRPLAELLPAVRRAGQEAGGLDAHGAALLGLPQGIPVAPAEGDQPAALAGSLIARPGMVAMSFGTSICANAVGDRPFEGVSRSIDHFCAPDGRPINMVWLRNGTTALNAVVGMFGGMLPPGADPFAAVMPAVLAAADDCGGLAALPFMDDEPGLGVQRGGSACLVGLDSGNATPGNAARAMLLATVYNLRLGSEPLDAQGFPRTEIVLSGGLVKTPGLGQVIADVFRVPVAIAAGAAEGSAFGAVLLAKYRDERSARGTAADDWPAFLARHDPGATTRFTPRPAVAAALDRGPRDSPRVPACGRASTTPSRSTPGRSRPRSRSRRCSRGSSGRWTRWPREFRVSGRNLRSLALSSRGFRHDRGASSRVRCGNHSRWSDGGGDPVVDARAGCATAAAASRHTFSRSGRPRRAAASASRVRTSGSCGRSHASRWRSAKACRSDRSSSARSRADAASSARPARARARDKDSVAT